jgi:hypothetical protein
VHAAEHLIKGGWVHVTAHHGSGNGQLMYARHPAELDRLGELRLD